MENASYIALSRQTALWRQMDQIANNMANVITSYSIHYTKLYDCRRSWRPPQVLDAEHQPRAQGIAGFERGGHAAGRRALLGEGAGDDS